MRPIYSPGRVWNKFTWGHTVLLAVFCSMMAIPAAAAGPGKAGVKAGAKIAKVRYHKLDSELNERTEKAGTSRVIIRFCTNGDTLSAVNRVGGRAGRKLGGMRGRVAELSNRQLKRLADDPNVCGVSDDRLAEADNGRTAVTTGSRFVNDVMGYTGVGIGVAVIDSGITPWHDDLTVANRQGQRVTAFVDFVNGRTTPYDDWGHGTHVAGIIAGNGYDSRGTRAGMASKANIIALKALDSQGRGRISDIIAALDWVVANRVQYNIRIVNMSLGAGVFESYHTDPLTLAAKRVVDAGVVVVAAAGNLGKALNGQPQYGAISAPGNAPWVLTVGASSTMGTVQRPDDTMASYSSRGPTMIDFIAKPDVVAPGTGTVSLAVKNSTFYTQKAAYLVSGSVSTPGFKPYLTLSGTSMATPVVAGTIATMLQANPHLTPNLVKATLQFTSQVYTGYDYLTQGAGFLNSLGAVRLSRYFAQGQKGQRYPNMKAWSKHILWGNVRVTGGVLAPGGTAWDDNIVWGESHTATGANIVWGEFCGNDCDNIVWGNNLVWGATDASDNIVWGNYDADNIVWGNSDVDNIVWGNGAEDNIVWGNAADDNIVWGNDCGGADCDNIVWGNTDEDNVVWGNAEGIDNIVWGNAADDNVVWGNSSTDPDISWGSSADDDVPVYGDETAELDSLDLNAWSEYLEPVVPEPSTVSEPPPATEPPATTTAVGV